MSEMQPSEVMLPVLKANLVLPMGNFIKTSQGKELPCSLVLSGTSKDISENAFV